MFWIFLLSTLSIAQSIHLPRFKSIKIRLPRKKPSYTPLLFFKVPPGLSPPCDELELLVKKVEKDLGVHVERLDILRDPAAEALLTLLTRKMPPLLYHRESCQTISVSTGSRISPDQVRAWAQGRLVTPMRVEAPKVKTPVLLNQDDKGMDQDELLSDMTLTPLQKKGKDAMKERSEKKAQSKRK
jgi:hypothetical protein